VKENVQTIVWVLEAVTFATTIVIAWVIWRVSKRDSENKKSKQKKL
jgi:uncharacterized membrane-anchored protein YhcB (DUF1043 family)